MVNLVENAVRASDFVWRPQPEAAGFVEELLRTFCRQCGAVKELENRLREATGTRLIDWIDHLAFPDEYGLAAQLAQLDFLPSRDGQRTVWRHPLGLIPSVEVHEEPTHRLAILVESVADFLVAQGLDSRTPIEGGPFAAMRKARIAAESGWEFWAVERHGYHGWRTLKLSDDLLQAVVHFQETFRLRRREFEDDAEGFEHTGALIRSAREVLGVHRTCDLFFAADREYWTRRNRAARVQKERQDLLGLGWANHDHHTYRSSREHFVRLIALFEELGLVCRERFYAGREAGWGAQVLEQPTAGIVIFADVDLAPDEVSGDFAHEALPPTDHLGTVGLWCRLHGEALLEAGMHHLECRFDFEEERRQLEQLGIRTMKPFTDLPYLKQAFTEAEVWRVPSRRLESALSSGAITREQFEQFRDNGALGSHLEILERDQGYRGFNRSGINDIIRATDPRRPST